MFEIVLRVLAAYTSSSRVWLLNQAHLQTCQAAASHDSTGKHSCNGEEILGDEPCVSFSSAVGPSG